MARPNTASDVRRQPPSDPPSEVPASTQGGLHDVTLRLHCDVVALHVAMFLVGEPPQGAPSYSHPAVG